MKMDLRDSEVDDRDAAEDYRRQRQEAAARKRGREPVGQYVYDREVVLEAARRAGATGQEIEAVADLYLKMLSELPGGSDFDDPSAIIMLGALIRRIEAVCSKVKLPTRRGVVFGNAVESGLIASQRAVLQTDVSIIEVTLPFLIFCHLVSKALAHTVPDPVADEAGISFRFNQELMKDRLNAEPWIKPTWVRILLAYAVSGEPPSGPGPLLTA
jgi:hypothetical protein